MRFGFYGWAKQNPFTGQSGDDQFNLGFQVVPTGSVTWKGRKGLGFILNCGTHYTGFYTFKA